MAKNKKTNSKTKNSKSKLTIVIFSILLLIALVFGILTFMPCQKYEKFAILSPDMKEKIVFKLEVADEEDERLKGLMNRKSLDENTGMIFDFEEAGYYSMWMKNTLIPLDMIFLNDNGMVIALAPNRQPMNEELINPCSVEFEKVTEKFKNIDEDTFYYRCETKFLKPHNLTRYVVELPAHTIEKANIKVGDILLKK